MLLNDNRIQNSVDEGAQHGGFRVVTIPRDIRNSICTRLFFFFNNEAFEDDMALLDTVFRRE